MTCTVLTFPVRPAPEADTDPLEPGPIAPMVALPQRHAVDAFTDECPRAVAA